MAKESDFTPGEWNLLADSPYLVGLSVIQADYSTAGSSREFFVLSEFCREAKALYGDVELIREILHCRTPEDSDDTQRQQMPLEALMNEIRAIIAIVDEKVPQDEAARFKEFLLEVAYKVAHAYADNVFGLGKKVSEKETAFLGQLKDCLGV